MEYSEIIASIFEGFDQPGARGPRVNLSFHQSLQLPDDLPSVSISVPVHALMTADAFLEAIVANPIVSASCIPSAAIAMSLHRILPPGTTGETLLFPEDYPCSLPDIHGYRFHLEENAQSGSWDVLSTCAGALIYHAGCATRAEASYKAWSVGSLMGHPRFPMPTFKREVSLSLSVPDTYSVLPCNSIHGVGRFNVYEGKRLVADLLHDPLTAQGLAWLDAFSRDYKSRQEVSL